MSDFDKHSRVNKFEKRRKNTKSISFLLILGGILIIVLLGMFLFGSNDEEAENGQAPQTASENSQSDDKVNDSEENSDSTEESNSDENQSTTDENATDESTNGESSDPNAEDEQNTSDENANNADLEKEPVEVTDNPNVKEAYTADWEPIGTEQEGPHTKKFEEGTQDRIEMEEAIRVATGLEQGNMITWWLENGGGQEVIGTVSNKAQDQTYRVYLTWVDNEGWKPTKVEVLKENPRD